MPPPALPAREMLKLPGQTTTAWAVFDASWYRTTYPDAAAELGEADDAAALTFYLEEGQKRGHSPNIWFDEAWHLDAHPAVAAAVRQGQAESGFDAYCRGGFRARSPHWLFNEPLYRQRHADLHDEVLARDGNANGYDHYLKHGSREDRIGHVLFDPVVYRAQLDPADQAEVQARGAFLHYLQHIAARRPELRTSHYFNPLWYLHQYPAVAEAIAKGQWWCALHHYLNNATPGEFDPLAEFSDRHYMSRNPDIAGAVQSKERRNGYDHFLRNGVFELRSPIHWIDLRYYVNTHPSVRADLEQGRARDAFVHYLTIGRAQGLLPALPPEDQVSEQQAVTLFRHRAHDLLPLAGRVPLDFTCSGAPDIGVVLVLCDEFPQTMQLLGSLRANYPGALELVLIDAGSKDETTRISSYVHGSRLLRFDDQIDLAPARNAGLQCVTADAVLFLDSGVAPGSGAIAAALRRLASDPKIGAVGAKIIRAHGRLQEAGGIVWRDGVAQAYLYDGSPVAPEANFVRDVDFCSETFLFVRTELLRQLEGFDDALGTGNFAAADLGVRITASGHRVVYDPAVAAYQLKVRSDAATDRAQQQFFRKHINHLRFRYIPDRRVEVFARSTDTGKRVLFVDDTIPLRLIGSGFVRSNDIIRAVASFGLRVTVFPVNASRFSLADIYADMPDTVEVMHDRTLGNFADFLAGRQGYYDVIWIARTHNLDRIKPMLEHITSGTGRPPRIVLDTEAIASLRNAGHAAITGEAPFDVDDAIMREFVNAHFCQSIIAVNADEAQKLRDLGFSDVAVIGHQREAQATPRPFNQRGGMLFIGAMHQTDSPNYDSLVWFIEKVLPLVEQSLGWETRLTIAGYTSPDVSLEQFRDHPRVTLLGTVGDTTRLYDSSRIFVAPTRYAAGTPYKVHEAASFGLPVVATELLRRQLGWENGRELLSADASDPEGFARQIVSLYRDADLWQSLRDHALDRIRTENSRSAYEAAICKVLDVVPVSPE